MDHLDRVVEVAGVPIRYSVTGSGPVTIALTHGYRAHHLWWAGVEPLLSHQYRIVQLDLSGSGDSGHRPEYTMALWGQEIIAVLGDAGVDRALLVGHSMGGISVVTAASLAPERAVGVILIDTLIDVKRRSRDMPEEERIKSTMRIYATRADGEARFRLLPPQDDVDPAVMARLAAYGIKEIDDGWTWKFDQVVPPNMDWEVFLANIADLKVPFHYVYGGRSGVVGSGDVDMLLTTAPEGSESTLLPDAHHHLTLSHPDVCARIIDEYATLWTASD